jgi:hypothetical protein
VKVGDVIRVIKIDPGLPDESRIVWEAALGKCFPITSIIESGAVEVEVSNSTEIDDDGVTLYISDCIYLDADEFEFVENPA